MKTNPKKNLDSSATEEKSSLNGKTPRGFSVKIEEKKTIKIHHGF
jgi:hypothetical protein